MSRKIFWKSLANRPEFSGRLDNSIFFSSPPNSLGRILLYLLFLNYYKFWNSVIFVADKF